MVCVSALTIMDHSEVMKSQRSKQVRKEGADCGDCGLIQSRPETKGGYKLYGGENDFKEHRSLIAIYTL